MGNPEKPRRSRRKASAPDSLHALMLADLARSGLDAADAKKLRLQPLTAAETRGATGHLNVPSYKIPYFDPAGDPTGFFRLRLLQRVADSEGKVIRYWQPPDSVPHAYFPPGVKWTKVMQNTDVTTVFTEGEKKAAKACKEGIVCIGLGGVWNFQSKEAHIDFLPALAAFEWDDRRAEIAYDGGDVEVDKSVKAARDRLQTRLEARGAHVITVELPAGEKLDDFLVGHRRDDYFALRRTGLDGWAPPAVVTYGASFEPAKIERREWVIAGRYARGETTAIIGPPATNKSMLLLNDAVQIATGTAIVPGDSVTRGGVLLLVGEDSRRDVETRLAAICQRHEIRPAALADRLHVVYQTEIDPTRYTLAHMEKDLAVLNRRMFDWLKTFPDVAAIIIDPMAAWNHVLENSNDALRVLMLGLRNLAASTRAAVAFDHHINKVSMGDPEAHVHNLAAARGGTYLPADMRWGFTMARLSAATAEEYGIEADQRRLYRRFDDWKLSHRDGSDGPLALFKVETVQIANGEDVGVMVAVEPEALRRSGDQRQEAKRREFLAGLTVCLATMLDKDGGPKSLNAAALWLSLHAQNLYVSAKTREPLADRSIRRKLLADIGEGLTETGRTGERGRRIVARPKGSGNYEISFADAKPA